MKILSKLILLLFLVTLVWTRSEYRVVNVNKTLSEVDLILRYTGNENYYGNEKNPIIKDLRFIFHVHAFYDFYVKITDINNSRYEVPQKDPWPIDPLSSFSYPINLCGVDFEYSTSPFDFKIIRKINGAVLFSTYDQDFVFS